MLTQIIGTFIVIYAILDIISTLAIRRNVKVIKDAIEETKEIVKDAVVVEETEEKEEKETKKKK